MNPDEKREKKPFKFITKVSNGLFDISFPATASSFAVVFLVACNQLSYSQDNKIVVEKWAVKTVFSSYLHFTSGCTVKVERRLSKLYIEKFINSSSQTL